MPRVVELRRYPVKSTTGEVVDHLDLEPRGAAGDRVWSVRTPEGKIGSGKSTAHRFTAVRGLLELRSRWSDGRVIVTFPGGETCLVDDTHADEVLSARLGRPLRFAREAEVPHFDDGPVSLLGTASLARLGEDVGEAVAPQRLRPNVLLATEVPLQEDGWLLREVRLGAAIVRVTMNSVRCQMVEMATAELPELPGVLLGTSRLNQTCLGVIAEVVRPGRVKLGDEARPV